MGNTKKKFYPYRLFDSRVPAQRAFTRAFFVPEEIYSSIEEDPVPPGRQRCDLCGRIGKQAFVRNDGLTLCTNGEACQRRRSAALMKHVRSSTRSILREMMTEEIWQDTALISVILKPAIKTKLSRAGQLGRVREILYRLHRHGCVELRFYEGNVEATITPKGVQIAVSDLPRTEWITPLGRLSGWHVGTKDGIVYLQLYTNHPVVAPATGEILRNGDTLMLAEDEVRLARITHLARTSRRERDGTDEVERYALQEYREKIKTSRKREVTRATMLRDRQAL